METNRILEQTDYPSIVLKVHNGLYAVNSRSISTIMQLPKYDKLPDAPPYVTGIFPYRDEIVKLVDLRLLFGLPSLGDEFDSFSQMLDARKQDHLNWVAELERTMDTGDAFTLATDPHKCAFGRWYDSFHTDNNAVAFHLRKIEEPHQLLHQAAEEAARCQRECQTCQRDECLLKILSRVKEQYMPTIVGLLDETKEIFHANIYHEMVVVLSGGSQLGIVVDEVLAVEVLSPAGDEAPLRSFYPVELVGGVCKSAKTDGLILQLNVENLVSRVNGVA